MRISTEPGNQKVVAITDSDPDFGTREQIFYFAFDGKREKQVPVRIIGE